MARKLAEQPLSEVLEHGRITFLYRPRVEEQHADELADVQRLLVLLAPKDNAFQRLIAIGRKRIPRSAKRDRFWGFVDLVLTPADMSAALDLQVYGTKTLGLRHLPAAKPFAFGSYSVETHADHAHLRWHLDRVAHDPIAFEVQVEDDADYLLTVANPDLSAWGLEAAPELQQRLFDDLELHVTIPSPFPAELQELFGGRRFLQVDRREWLDHPGAELVFIGSGDR
jgi:hypothetical protein